jgi:exo-beta-1,3-glucanase (GH17 family)
MMSTLLRYAPLRLLLVMLFTPFLVGFSTIESYTSVNPATLFSLCWVAYAPSNNNPDQGASPNQTTITADLNLLRNAGFNGLITYGTSSTQIATIAQQVGFEGMLAGIWDPTSTTERQNAIAVGGLGITQGYIIGNEGLGIRYSQTDLQNAAAALLAATPGKAITTTEEGGDYLGGPHAAFLRTFGDFVAPNVHPYWGNAKEPAAAVQFTVNQHNAIDAVTALPVLLKEVGLPTAGDPETSQQRQRDYYIGLQDTHVRFTYFEAFDQPWKDNLPVEPYWGLYTWERQPKLVVPHVCRNLVSNGDFRSNSATNWLTYASITSRVSNGRFEFYRAPGSTSAVVYQNTAAALAANTPLMATFSLGNSSTRRKRVTVLIHASDFSDLQVCSFWLPPNAPLRTYTMLTHTKTAWAGTSISFYASTADGQGWYQLDHVSLRRNTSVGTAQTRCIDPRAPTVS